MYIFCTGDMYMLCIGRGVCIYYLIIINRRLIYLLDLPAGIYKKKYIIIIDLRRKKRRFSSASTKKSLFAAWYVYVPGM